MSRMKFELTAEGIIGGSVVIDGLDVSSSVRAYDLHAEVGKIPVLVLDLLPFDRSVSGQAHVRVPDKTRAVLVQLGWTPPEEVTP